ncbi:MAG: hypothetical protein ACRDF6_13950, partial [bacterium]
MNAELRVGSLEETITVTGESPVVDVQSTRAQSIIDREVLAAIPSSRNVNGIQAIIPGMGTSGDDGGIGGSMQGGASNIHGGRSADSRIHADGINMGWAGGNGGGGQMPQVAASQEVVMTTSGGLAEAETAGVVFNAIPREGSNTLSGQFNFSGSNGALQGSNYTQALKDAGLRAPFELLSVYDSSGMVGGKILQDKLWFYAVYRQVGGKRTVPGMFFNKNAGNPDVWTYEPDTSRPAANENTIRNGNVRITWQAAPRHKLGFAADITRICDCPRSQTASLSPEANAGNYQIDSPKRQIYGEWTSPLSNRLLLDAVVLDHVHRAGRQRHNVFFPAGTTARLI